LDRIVNVELEVTRRIASHVVSVGSGFIALHEKYPASHDNNVLEVTQWCEPGEIVRDLERVFDSAGLQYHHIHVRDEGLAHRLAPVFIDMGFEQSVRLVMVFAGSTCGDALCPVDRVQYEEMARDVEQAWRRELPGSSEEGIRQLMERRLAREAVCEMSYHVVRQNGRCVSRCEVSRYDGVVLIDGVITDPGWQRRGFARAVVLDAVALAQMRGSEVVWLEAEREEWPQHFYRRLGFREIGLVHGYWRAG
jgi:GNAT superfamily N-acetyltransferase